MNPEIQGTSGGQTWSKFDMTQERTQSVLRCKLCNKPFDRESTLKRHGYYCRSRRIGTSTRPRSCMSCAKSKVKCDNKRPKCARCRVKGVNCLVPASESQSVASKPPAHSNETALSPKAHTQHLNLEAYGDFFVDDNLDLSDADFENFPDIDWNDTAIDFTSFYDPKWSAETTLVSPFERSRTMSAYLTPPLTQDSLEILTRYPSPSLAATHLDVPRSIVKRPKGNLGLQRTAILMQQTLKSYLGMILRDGSLPPFIHPHILELEFENNDMESLVNCVSLIQMLKTEARGSRKIFWKSVRIECERFYHDVSGLCSAPLEPDQVLLVMLSLVR
jgi:hypothetical protein